MTLDEFRASLSEDIPPYLSAALRALWLDGKGDWDGAHEAAQADSSPEGAWVHAYLHRKEGDLGNAGYWYRLAGRKPATVGLGEEWGQIVTELLKPTP